VTAGEELAGTQPSEQAGRLWGGRFSSGPEASAWQLGLSTHFDVRLWREDLAGSRAHAQELARIGVLGADEHAQLDAALVRCGELFATESFLLEPGDEDLHGAIERWLVEELGDLGGRLRAGRSRNDQIVSDLRLWSMAACDRIVVGIGTLQTALLDQAEAHLDWLAPSYTHLQRAQPTVLAHPLLAFVWMLQRDAERVRDARGRIDRSVLGSGAVAGQTLGLDPERYAELLGFSATTENSIDATASRDFVLELAAALAICATTCSRLGEELVLWSTTEFGFVRLGDGFSTGSSMMPQKRNPDVAELVRGKAGRVVGDLMALLTIVKGLPLAYDRDLQEDKEPIFDAVDTLELVLPALAGAVASCTFDRERLEAAASDDFALATDVAEALVLLGVPFREAHERVGALVRSAELAGVGLRDLDAATVAAAHPELVTRWDDLLDPRAAVARRIGRGGTAPDAVREQLRRARAAAATIT
jgi:argininosuccinate lyase